MERALARRPWPRLLPKNWGAHARIYPSGKWLAILVRKDVQKEGYTPVWVGLCSPGHAGGQTPGPSPEGVHFAWSRASATKYCPKEKSRGTLFFFLVGGRNQGLILVQSLRVGRVVGA